MTTNPKAQHHLVTLQQRWIRSGSQWLATAQISPTQPAINHHWFIFLHGWTSWKDERDYAHVKLARYLAEHSGYNSLLFDYRGHGESTGVLAEVMLDDLVADAHAVFDWLMQNVCPAQIYLVTTGVSAVVALQLATQIKLAGLIMLSPAITLPKALIWYADLHLIPFCDLLAAAQLSGAEQAVRESLLHLGALPDHAAGEVIDTHFWKHPLLQHGAVALIACCPCRIHAYFDPQAPLLEIDYLSGHSHVTQMAVTSGGPLFRHPQLLNQIAEHMIDWTSSPY